MLLLIRLKQRGIRTNLRANGGSQHCPAVGLWGRCAGLALHHEAIADDVLRHLRLRRPTAPRPLLALGDRLHTIMQGMIAPRLWCAPPPPSTASFVLRDGCLRIGGTGKPAGCHPLAMRRDVDGLLGLSRAVGAGRLVS